VCVFSNACMYVRPCVYVSSCVCVAMRVVVRVRENRCLLCVRLHMSECVRERGRVCM
jgi:hypothetical protein